MNVLWIALFSFHMPLFVWGWKMFCKPKNDAHRPTWHRDNSLQIIWNDPFPFEKDYNPGDLTNLVTFSASLSPEARIRLETWNPRSPQQRVRDAERPGLEHRVRDSRGGREPAGQVGARRHLLQNGFGPHHHPRYRPPSPPHQHPRTQAAATEHEGFHRDQRLV